MTQLSNHPIRTPLGRAKGLGSAHSGTHHWWMVRMTSIPLIPLFIYFMFQLKYLTNPDRLDLVDWIRQPDTSIGLIVFVLCAFFHASIGLDEIIADYFSKTRAKAVMLMLLNRVFFVSLAVTSIYAVVYINFGAI